MSNEERVYKIGEAAKLLATSIRAIRYYEAEGLVTPKRSDKGTRFYTERLIDRLRAIRQLMESGHDLQSIRTLASTREKYSTGDRSQEAVCIQLDTILAGIHGQIDRLRSLAVQIETAKTKIRKCRGCGNRPTSQGCPDCPVRRHLSEIEVLNLVWDQDSH